MNDNLCAESGYVSLNKAGETLCGDRVEIVGDSDNLVLVLADGLGSGVKANILSTLTAKILGTMIAGGMPVDECVDTMIRTLPVCRERGIAYSTFTVIHSTGTHQVRLIQFDNPEVIALRDGVPWPTRRSGERSPGGRSWRAASRRKKAMCFWRCPTARPTPARAGSATTAGSGRTSSSTPAGCIGLRCPPRPTPPPSRRRA
jgi:hypothetical protein